MDLYVCSPGVHKPPPLPFVSVLVVYGPDRSSTEALRLSRWSQDTVGQNSWSKSWIVAHPLFPRRHSLFPDD